MLKDTRRLWLELFRIKQRFIASEQEVCPTLIFAALKQCCNLKDVEYGTRVHENLTEQGMKPGTSLSNILIELYRRCRSIPLALEVFDNMTERNVVTWNCLIMSYVENGESQKALKLFESMDCQPNHVTYLAALKACVALADQKHTRDRLLNIHRRIDGDGFAANTAVGNTLVTAYTKCRDMASAKNFFLSIIKKNVVSWTCLINGYVENGESALALELFWDMDCDPDHVTCLSALKACVGLATENKEKALKAGVAIHKLVNEKFVSNLVVNNTLIDMYSKCGDICLVKSIFDRLKCKDVVTWNCLIQGYVENGKSQQALESFGCMDCEPNAVTYLGALKACIGLANDNAFLAKAKAIHEQIKARRLDHDTTIANMLLEMYCKYGEMELAEETFNGIVHKNVVSWTCLMLGYVENGETGKALGAFTQMDCQPDQVSCVVALKACIKLSLSAVNLEEKEKVLERGIAVHKIVVDLGFTSDVVLGNTLLEMYRKCGDMPKCRKYFETMSHKNVVTWNSLMLGYVENSEFFLALETFECMDCEPNHITFLAVLKACTGISLPTSKRLEKGIAIHERIKGSSYDSDVVLASGLVEFYSSCGEMKKARDVFDNASPKDVVLWNSLMSGYIENSDSLSALELFSRMERTCEPNHVTYLAVLKACAILAVENPASRATFLNKGIRLHERIKETGDLLSNVMVSCSLIDMYSKCGEMELAREVFDKMEEKCLVAWNSLLLGYVEKGKGLTALDLLTKIDRPPDHVTYVAALRACASLAGEVGKGEALQEGLALHRRIRELGFDSNVFVSSTLVDMYCKCMETGLAKEVFDGIQQGRDVVTWNCLILGYADNDESWLALELFTRMDCEPTPVTYLAVLKACSRAGALPFGRIVHGTVCRLGLEEEAVMATALVDLYGSCGCMDTAAHVFDGIRSPGLASWNALMARYSSLGEVAQVFMTARKAEEAGIQLDSISFIHVLTACSHAGLVERSEMHFECMQRQGITPVVEHYNCMVDMLGRANKLEKAMKIVRDMGSEANEVTWMTLLGACKKWNNLEVGRVAFDAMVTYGRGRVSAAAYVMMADIYGRQKQ